MVISVHYKLQHILSLTPWCRFGGVTH